MHNLSYAAVAVKHRLPAGSPEVSAAPDECREMITGRRIAVVLTKGPTPQAPDTLCLIVRPHGRAGCSPPAARRCSIASGPVGRSPSGGCRSPGRGAVARWRTLIGRARPTAARSAHPAIDSGPVIAPGTGRRRSAARDAAPPARVGHPRPRRRPCTSRRRCSGCWTRPTAPRPVPTRTRSRSTGTGRWAWRPGSIRASERDGRAGRPARPQRRSAGGPALPDVGGVAGCLEQVRHRAARLRPDRGARGAGPGIPDGRARRGTEQPRAGRTGRRGAAAVRRRAPPGVHPTAAAARHHAARGKPGRSARRVRAAAAAGDHDRRRRAGRRRGDLDDRADQAGHAPARAPARARRPPVRRARARTRCTTTRHTRPATEARYPPSRRLRPARSRR